MWHSPTQGLTKKNISRKIFKQHTQAVLNPPKTERSLAHVSPLSSKNIPLIDHLAKVDKFAVEELLILKHEK